MQDHKGIVLHRLYNLFSKNYSNQINDMRYHVLFSRKINAQIKHGCDIYLLQFNLLMTFNQTLRICTISKVVLT